MVTVRYVVGQLRAGDTDAYLRSVADAARELADRVDVIVLAQASMAGAERRLVDLAVPVLSSPVMAVRHAVALLGWSSGAIGQPSIEANGRRA